MEATVEPFFQTASKTCHGFQTIVENYPKPMQGLYGAYCTVNGKWYIGISKNVLRRSSKHAENDTSMQKFKNALRKHGVANFIFIPLCYAPNADRDWLHEKETELILLFDSIENGYNVVLMGQGPIYGPEHGKRVSVGLAQPIARAKVLAANRRITSDPLVRAKISTSTRLSYENPAIHEDISQKVTASWQDPDTRQRQLNARRTPEARARVSATLQSPESIAKRNIVLRDDAHRSAAGVWLNAPDVKARANATLRDPEVQRKKAINQSTHYDKPGVREAHGNHMKEINAADPTINDRRAESVRKSWEVRRAKKAALLAAAQPKPLSE